MKEYKQLYDRLAYFNQAVAYDKLSQSERVELQRIVMEIVDANRGDCTVHRLIRNLGRKYARITHRHFKTAYKRPEASE